MSKLPILFAAFTIALSGLRRPFARRSLVVRHDVSAPTTAAPMPAQRNTPPGDPVRGEAHPLGAQPARLMRLTRLTAWWAAPRRACRLLSGREVGRRLLRRTLDIPPGPVADWCDELSRQLRAGLTLRSSLESTIPTHPALRDRTGTMRLAIQRGRTTADALATVLTNGTRLTSTGHSGTGHSGTGHSGTDLAAADLHSGGSRAVTLMRFGTCGADVTGTNANGRTHVRHVAHLDVAVGVMIVTARLGGSNAAAIDRVGAALRMRAADREERAAQSAQARMSAHVMTVVPLAMLTLLAVTDPDVRTALGSPAGMWCIAIGLTFNAAGWCWMRRSIGSSG